jgi:hypothetical protein
MWPLLRVAKACPGVLGEGEKTDALSVSSLLFSHPFSLLVISTLSSVCVCMRACASLSSHVCKEGTSKGPEEESAEAKKREEAKKR